MAAPKHGNLRYQCVFCDKRFPKLYRLDRHLLAHTKENPVHCRFCKLELRNKESLICHLAKLHSKEVKLSGKGKRSKNWEQIKSKYERCIKYTCVFCDKCYVCETDFESHIRSHIGEKPYQCTKCYLAFTEKRLLRTHYQYLHGEHQTLYQCELCIKSYTGKTGLKRHFQSQHPGKRLSFQITKIKRKSKVQNYPRKQMNVGPIQCQECGKRFSTTQSLTVHYKLYHAKKIVMCKVVDPVLNRIMQTRHKCVFCGKGFPRSFHLKRHLNAETRERPYFCHICGKELKRHIQLRNHLYKTHKILPERIEKRNGSEKPERYSKLSCVFCQKFFTQSSELEGHIRTHIDERPFHCPYCPKGVTQKRFLKKHIETVHPDEQKSKPTKNKKSHHNENKNFNGQSSSSSSFDIEKCRAGLCKWCKAAVKSRPVHSLTYICPDPDPTGNDPVRCGKKFQCLYQMALYFRDDHRTPVFQSMKTD